MKKTTRIPIWFARLGFSLGGILLITGMILSQVQSPVLAASFAAPAGLEELPPTEAPVLPPTTEAPQDPPQDPPTATPTVLTCDVPGNWDGTIRLFYSKTASKEWHFDVEEPEMNVTLVFYYYQDYQKNGCPKDCSTDPNCQSDEIGEGDTPLGSFSISDGQIGPNDGKVKLKGRLSKGSYTASFHVTGKGSINIGMKVQKSSIPPTATPTAPPPSPTPTLTIVTPTSTLPAGTPTATPDSTTTIEPPGDTPTATPTPTEEDRPHKTHTPAPPTLPPPTPPPGTALPPAIVPVTGGDLSTASGPLARHQAVLIPLGIGLLGLGLIFHGISRRLKNL